VGGALEVTIPGSRRRRSNRRDVDCKHLAVPAALKVKSYSPARPQCRHCRSVAAANGKCNVRSPSVDVDDDQTMIGPERSDDRGGHDDDSCRYEVSLGKFCFQGGTRASVGSRFIRRREGHLRVKIREDCHHQKIKGMPDIALASDCSPRPRRKREIYTATIRTGPHAQYRLFMHSRPRLSCHRCRSGTGGGRGRQRCSSTL
jgi:hypothetical protein